MDHSVGWDGDRKEVRIKLKYVCVREQFDLTLDVRPISGPPDLRGVSVFQTSHRPIYDDRKGLTREVSL